MQSTLLCISVDLSNQTPCPAESRVGLHIMLWIYKDCSRAFVNPQQADEQCHLCCQAWLLGAAERLTMLVCHLDSCSSYSLKGTCLTWRVGVTYGAERKAISWGPPSSCRESGIAIPGNARIRICTSSACLLAHVSHVLFQAPGTVLHLPVAAGIQEENCCCASRQRERLRTAL